MNFIDRIHTKELENDKNAFLFICHFSCRFYFSVLNINKQIYVIVRASNFFGGPVTFKVHWTPGPVNTKRYCRFLQYEEEGRCERVREAARQYVVCTLLSHTRKPLEGTQGILGGRVGRRVSRARMGGGEREQQRQRGDRCYGCTETVGQGFMQDHIIASHSYFGGHMDVNC